MHVKSVIRRLRLHVCCYAWHTTFLDLLQKQAQLPGAKEGGSHIQLF